jgi:hypothetical protein
MLTKVAINPDKHYCTLDDYLKNNLGLKEGISYMITDSQNFLQGALNKKIQDWIIYGSEMEDYLMCRRTNHFHNPLISPWHQAGLKDPETISALYCSLFFHPYSFGRARSNLTWATSYEISADNPDLDEAGMEFNKLDWTSAREYFYVYLTGKDFQNQTKATNQAEREEYLAKSFRSLGQVVHLLQDVAVPAHTRNDYSQGHTDNANDPDSIGGLGNRFETYVKMNMEKKKWYDLPAIKGNLNQRGLFPGLHETKFWDTDVYAGQDPDTLEMPKLGLAEYSNMNFISEYTIFTDFNQPDDPHYFPYPKVTSCEIAEPVQEELEDGSIHNVIYLNKIRNGETIDQFVRPNYLCNEINENWPEFEPKNGYTLTEKCYDQYASRLIPRAIGYSAQLLDYFFRGDMDIREAKVRLGPGLTITGMDFEVKNNTFENENNQIIESFKAGVVDISCQYYLDGQEDPNYVVVNNVYTISDASDVINSNYVSISVNFPDGEVIPYGAKDISFTLVFRGKLGNESGAVAAKYHGFGEESRIAYHYQPGGGDNPSNVYTILPDETDEEQITFDGTPDTYLTSPTWSPDGTRMAFEYERCSNIGQNGICGEYVRDIHVIDMTPDSNYPQISSSPFHLIDLENFAVSTYLQSVRPSFSQDGNQLVAIAVYPPVTALVVIDVSTGSWDYINGWEYWFPSGMGKEINSPAWSPKFDEIAYYVYRGHDPNNPDGPMEELKDICIINADGTGNRWLTRDSYTNAEPSWSPDGQWLVFVSDRDGGGNMDIWIMDRLGQQIQMIRDCGGDCSSPSFSPDGLQIAFEANGDIYTINLDGSGLTQVTTTGHNYSPEWSPFLENPPNP